VDHPDASLGRLEWGEEGDSLATNQQLTLIGLINAGQNLDECGLTSTVFPKQRLDFAGPHGEVDFLKRFNARETFRNFSYCEHINHVPPQRVFDA